jgi:uncharacterized protein
MEYAYEQVEVVIKIAERCNINCSYCYMFNLGNDDYLKHAIYISNETILATAKFLAQGAKDLKIKTIKLILHGGEPLMLKKEKFTDMCLVFERELSPFSAVQFVIQTNAMLIDDEWIDIFERFKIGIGVSIDGPKEYHDRVRVDHQGHGTYDRVIMGLQKLQHACKTQRIGELGILCVINPEHDAKRIYRHLVDDLNIKRLSFLLPMETCDSAQPVFISRLGNYLCTLLGEWIADDAPQIGVRIISQAVSYFTQHALPHQISVTPLAAKFALFTVDSDGGLGADDDLKPINIGQDIGNVSTHSLVQFLSDPVFRYLDDAAHSIPTACRDCCWQNYCRGGAQNGAMLNRYSVENDFDNASVFCSGLQQFYSQIAQYLLGHGLAYEQLANILDYENSPFVRPIPKMPSAFKTRAVINIASLP